MSKEVTKAILTKFEDLLKPRVPQFQRFKGEPLPGGCRLYRWQYSSGLTFYLLMNVVRGEKF